MKMLLLIACCVLGFGVTLPESQAQPASLGDTPVRFAQTYAAAADTALRHFNGDLLIYVYRPERPAHQRILTRAFNRERLAAYINENFGRVAVDLDTVHAGSPLYKYRREAPEDVFVVLLDLLSANWPSEFEMYGWKRMADDADEAHALALLQRFKHPPPRKATPARERSLSCEVSGEAWLIVTEGEKCMIEQLQARCSLKEDACLAACLAGGRWRSIGGGCFHACLAYREHDWTQPNGFAECRASR